MGKRLENTLLRYHADMHLSSGEKAEISPFFAAQTVLFHKE